MGARARRAVAAVATLLYLAAYVAGAVTLADRLPNVAVDFGSPTSWRPGSVWVIPVMPILAWAEHGSGRKRTLARNGWSGGIRARDP